jgi:NADH:ubiquinone oxidoreductase subunit F (NADH-binding)
MTDLAALSGSQRLLAGTSQGQRITYEQHLELHGAVALPTRKQAHQWRSDLLAQIKESGLTGRGGGGFSTATKLEAYSHGHRRHAMVINVMEGEPAAQKDSVLACFTPHLILDGAEVMATLVHASSLTIAVARDNPAAYDSLALAVDERRRRGKRPFDITVVAPPGRYIAGEESALANWLDGAMSLPTFRETKPARLPIRGKGGVIDNAETAADVALIARHGGAWFAAGGHGTANGTTLVTVSGTVEDPGVFEVPLGTTVADVIRLARPKGQITGLLLGGYGGTFVGPAALDAPYSPEGLRPFGGNIGAGIIVVFNTETCALDEVARIVHWMANESAGQCGPCIFGLPALAGELDRLAAARQIHGVEQSLHDHLAVINGRGACAHPDGVVRMVRTALEVFSAEVAHHLGGRRCVGVRPQSILNLPPNEGDLVWK